MNNPETNPARFSPGQLSDRFNAEISKLIAETGKLNAETGRISAGTSKINAESRWYPFAVVAGIMAVMGGVMGALIKFVF